MQPEGSSSADQVIVLFVHIPKSAGTSIRDMFERSRHVWYVTRWYFYRGMLSSMVGAAVHKGTRRIFAEWHNEYNYSALPLLRADWHARAPNTRNLTVRTLTVLRPPTDLAASNCAFWFPRLAATVCIRVFPEWLLADVLQRSSHSHMLENEHRDATAVHDCRVEPWADLEDRAHCEAFAKGLPIREPKNATNVLPSLFGPEGRAVHALRRAAAIRRRTSTHAGCERLLTVAMGLIGQLDHIFFLSDPTTFPALHALSQSGDLATLERGYTPPALASRTPHRAASQKAQYQTSDARALLKKANTCSEELYQRIVRLRGRAVISSS